MSAPHTAHEPANREAHMREELASALTHGVGATAALAGGAVLVTLAALYGDGWQLSAAIVFGITLLLLYVASTLYHAIQHPVVTGRLKVVKSDTDLAVAGYQLTAAQVETYQSPLLQE